MAGMCGLCNIVFGGHDARPGKGADYVCYVWLEGGWGGRVAKRDNHTAMTLFGSSATNQPIEMQERVFPHALHGLPLRARTRRAPGATAAASASRRSGS